MSSREVGGPHDDQIVGAWPGPGRVEADPIGSEDRGFTPPCKPSGACTTAGQTNGGPCGVNTASDGTFGELALGGCSPVCYVNNACTTGGPSSVTQTWHVAGYSIA